MIAIDTSALVGIMNEEPECRRFTEVIAEAPRRIISGPTMLETCMVLAGDGPRHKVIWVDLADWVQDAGIRIVESTSEQMTVARDAFARHGKGRNPAAALNFGDCISYALAKTHRVPLLFKGNALWSSPRPPWAWAAHGGTMNDSRRITLMESRAERSLLVWLDGVVGDVRSGALCRCARRRCANQPADAGSAQVFHV